MSQYIINLEKSLGVAIFNRSSYPVSLTKAGEIFVEAATKMRDIEDQLFLKINDLSNSLQGNICVGTSQFITTHIMPYVLMEFQSNYPMVNVTLLEALGNEREKAAMQGNIDLFFSNSRSLSDTLEYVNVMDERILVALPPSHRLNSPLAATEQAEETIPNLERHAYNIYTDSTLHDFPEIGVDAMKNEPFIMLQPYLSFGKVCHEICNKHGFTPNVVLYTRSLDAIRSMVYSGLGCGFLPESMVRFSAYTNHPIYYRINETRSLYLVYRKDRYLSKAASEFVSITKKVLSGVINNN